MTNSTLTGAQRRQLRALAHHLNPAVTLGKEGVSSGLIAELERALDQHELVKVRLGEYKDQKKVLAEALAEAGQAELVGLVGHQVILYRRQSNPKKRVIRLQLAPTPLA
ncbi:MAG: ribosome assembly RNA-binding protein YhbY [Magnetococcus sp. WYHC-3]